MKIGQLNFFMKNFAPFKSTDSHENTGLGASYLISMNVKYSFSF